ncbi:hypothetical protein [Burkholderia lata]|uniref:hypothetical protein n=1 Tax=Burkholderia lata (strain ATCC 17760 / DSM 23089 / LMG 22485 / NCIMB 9086 / R18194 / 383) TaxID=482957 RepID=UPI0012E9E100|nr:hypothetical protein [Burkholderia lata]
MKFHPRFRRHGQIPVPDLRRHESLLTGISRSRYCSIPHMKISQRALLPATLSAFFKEM